MVNSFYRRLLLIIFACTILANCGTKFACGPEFGAPPERAFWCAPLTALGEYFTVQPPPPPPPQPTVKCDKTLGERECRAL